MSYCEWHYFNSWVMYQANSKGGLIANKDGISHKKV